MSDFMGEPVFNRIVIDSISTGQGLSIYVSAGSQLHYLTPSDIHVIVCAGTDTTRLRTATDMILAGAQPFDAIAYMHCDENLRPAIIVDSNYAPTDVKDIGIVAQYIFVAYMFIVTQARYPDQGDGDALRYMPKFVTEILSIKATQKELSSALASFPLGKFDPAWVRSVNFGHIGQEARSRIALGQAGGRLIKCVYNNPPDHGDQAVRTQFMEFVNELHRSIDRWDFHPTFRSTTIVKQYTSLNKNFGNAILELYTPKAIKKMVKEKQLAVIPTRAPGYNAWKTWKASEIPEIHHPIFPHEL